MGTADGVGKRHTDCLYITSSGHSGGPNMVQILSERCKVISSYKIHVRISVRCAVIFWELSTVTYRLSHFSVGGNMIPKILDNLNLDLVKCYSCFDCAARTYACV
jgi:hypothetical protein